MEGIFGAVTDKFKDLTDSQNTVDNATETKGIFETVTDKFKDLKDSSNSQASVQDSASSAVAKAPETGAVEPAPVPGGGRKSRRRLQKQKKQGGTKRQFRNKHKQGGSKKKRRVAVKRT